MEAYAQSDVHTIPDGERLVATFTVIGNGWYWFKDAVAQLGPGSDVDKGTLNYAAVQFSLIDRVATSQCMSTSIHWADAASTPLGIALYLREFPESRRSSSR